jgi:hypothetical protein
MALSIDPALKACLLEKTGEAFRSGEDVTVNKVRKRVEEEFNLPSNHWKTAGLKEITSQIVKAECERVSYLRLPCSSTFTLGLLDGLC